MQTFAKLALAAGACALGLGAVLPVQAADMGYPEAQGRLPGAAARLLRAAAGTAGLLRASAARRVWLSAASARRIRHLRRAALRRRAGTVLAGRIGAATGLAMPMAMGTGAAIGAGESARRRGLRREAPCPGLSCGVVRVGFAALSRPLQKTWIQDKFSRLEA